MNCTDQMVPEYKFFANNQTTINVLVFDIVISVDKLLPKSQKLMNKRQLFYTWMRTSEPHFSPETSPIIDSGKIFKQFQGFLYKLSVCRLAKITSMRLNYL